MKEVIPKPVGIGPNPQGGILYHECCPCDGDEWLSYYADDDQREEWKAIMDEEPPEKLPLCSNRDTWLELLAEAYRDQPLPVYETEEA